MAQGLEEVCRLCLSKERLMLPIFKNCPVKDETTFRSKVMSCASVEIFTDDDLPSKVCYLCVHQVEKFFQFQAMCEKSDLVLRSQLREIKTVHRVDGSDKSIGLSQDMNQEGDKFGLVDYYLPDGSAKTSQDLTCNICASIFVSNNQLIDHLIKDHPDLNVFFCKSCKASFPDVNLFRNHFNTHHNLICNHCDCVFKHETNLKDHLKIHIDSYSSCKYCLKPFSSFYEMKKHELIHRQKSCGYCQKEFTSENDYNSHFKTCDQMHHCKLCKQAFKLKKDLIEHVNTHHNSRAESPTSFHLQPTNEPQHTNDESGVDQAFQCGTCQLQLSDELSLVSHMATVHNDAVLTCKFCSKKFGLRTSLKRHERSHSGIKPYQCKFCPRKFKDSSACVVHTRTHTGEHPFRCQECHKDFKQLANLKMHTYRHHKKNKKGAEPKAEVTLNEGGNDEYDHLYGGHILENYSGDNLRGFQGLNESIENGFNQGMNILMGDHHST